MEDWKNVKSVFCKPDVVDPFSLICTINTDTGEYQVKDIYSCVAHGIRSSVREVDESRFYFSEKKGLCRIRDYERLGYKVKILDCSQG